MGEGIISPSPSPCSVEPRTLLALLAAIAVGGLLLVARRRRGLGGLTLRLGYSGVTNALCHGSPFLLPPIV